jgi:hypothetical protein
MRAVARCDENGSLDGSSVMKLRRLTHAVLAAVLLACNGDDILSPPLGYPHSAATNTCGPADGPAVAIMLAKQPITSLQVGGPHIRLFIWRSLGEIEGHTWSIQDDGMQASASFNSGSTYLESATSGSIHIESVSDDNTVAGNMDVTFADHGRVRGGFTAHWIANQMLCP